jgi:hypothetical protein
MVGKWRCQEKKRKICAEKRASAFNVKQKALSPLRIPIRHSSQTSSFFLAFLIFAEKVSSQALPPICTGGKRFPPVWLTRYSGQSEPIGSAPLGVRALVKVLKLIDEMMPRTLASHRATCMPWVKKLCPANALAEQLATDGAV